MRNLLLIFSIVFLISCHQKKTTDDGIEIFNNFSFTIKDSETLKPLANEIHKEYDSLAKRKNLQIPLFKYIESTEYKIFLGLPYNSSLKKIRDQEILPGTLRTAHKEEDGKYTYKTYTANGTYLAEYAESLDGNLIYVLGISKSKKEADSAFSLMALSNRINKP